eukprot:TRINITY_DN66651_c2_g2_i1.p1 TRINITY_DN66651_c2_g2~~TRINITY_DN66651_c2_g2_i1.p1  ORF type:complete len:399 (-),score=54.95 TRINITY_DN66651_c2_g2_i1:105-1301(-)
MDSIHCFLQTVSVLLVPYTFLAFFDTFEFLRASPPLWTVTAVATGIFFIVQRAYGLLLLQSLDNDAALQQKEHELQRLNEEIVSLEQQIQANTDGSHRQDLHQRAVPRREGATRRIAHHNNQQQQYNPRPPLVRDVGSSGGGGAMTTNFGMEMQVTRCWAHLNLEVHWDFSASAFPLNNHTIGLCRTTSTMHEPPDATFNLKETNRLKGSHTFLKKLRIDDCRSLESELLMFEVRLLKNNNKELLKSSTNVVNVTAVVKKKLAEWQRVASSSSSSSCTAQQQAQLLHHADSTAADDAPGNTFILSCSSCDVWTDVQCSWKSKDLYEGQWIGLFEKDTFKNIGSHKITTEYGEHLFPQVHAKRSGFMSAQYKLCMFRNHELLTTCDELLHMGVSSVERL